MIACFVCGTELADDTKACSVCGTSLAPVSAKDDLPPVLASLLPLPALAGNRACPVCGKHYDDSHTDSFCACGAALVRLDEEAHDLPLERPDEAAAPLPLEQSAAPAAAAAEGPRLVVYSADKQPIHTLLLDRDVTRIGRNDPIRGDFVDLDVGQLLDEETARKVSRKHAVILRSRETHTFTLRPLARNTGTQVGNDLAVELQDYPLSDGTRIVLGGAVRLKFLSPALPCVGEGAGG
jgi:hypothetical protein